MQLARLNFSQTYARVGIERTPSDMQIRTTQAQVRIHQKQAKVNLESDKPKVLIDQYPCRASIGQLNNEDFLRDNAERGRQAALDNIARIASEGDQLAAIEHGNPIADIAWNNAFPQTDWTIGFMPSAPPKFEVTGSLKIMPEPNGEGVHNGVEFEVEPGTLSYDYTPAKVQSYMLQYNQLKIDYVPGGNVDETL